MPNLNYLNYLRELPMVVIPTEFTYFVHNTLFGKNEKRFDKMWEKMPIDSFTVERNMSFVERDSRVAEALDYGSMSKASNSYAVNNRGKNFQIRVIMPKQFLTPSQLEMLEITPEEKKLLDSEYRGLGDQRHPKLQRGENIYIFASTTKDEISNKDIDILYGIREQDIERYAKLVQKTLKQESIKPFDLTDRTHDGTASREEAENDYLEATKVPYALDRDSDLSRYSRSYIYGEDGELQLVGYSKFEKEFIQETGIYPNINSENNNKNAKKEITFQDIGKGTIDSFKKNVENSDYNLDFVEQEINEQEQDKGKN